MVGFMGSGKSTVGPLLAGTLGWSFVDLDQEIEREKGCAIREIFERDGELEFRKIETQVLRQLETREPCIVALGGGAFAWEENRPIVSQLGVSIFLDCRLDVILARCPADGSRPLFQTMAGVRELYEFRLPSYRMCDIRVDVSDLTPGESAKAILHALGTTV